jgi:hypothetical protein
MLFAEGDGNQLTGLEIIPRGPGAVLDASETQPAQRSAAHAQAPAGPALVERAESTRRMIRQFCRAIREGAPLACGADKAFDSARACIRANEAVETRTRLTI